MNSRRMLTLFVAPFLVFGFAFIQNASAQTNPTPPIIIYFTATPSSISTGESSTLSWATSFDTTSCSLGAPLYLGNQSPISSTAVTPSQTTSYTLTCSNASGLNKTSSATVNVIGSVTLPNETTNGSAAITQTTASVNANQPTNASLIQQITAQITALQAQLSALIQSEQTTSTNTPPSTVSSASNPYTPQGYTEVYTQHNYNKTWHVYYSPSSRTWIIKKTDDKSGGIDWSHGPITNINDLGNSDNCGLVDAESGRPICMYTAVPASIQVLTSNYYLAASSVPKQVVFKATLPSLVGATYDIGYNPQNASWYSEKIQNGNDTWIHPNLSSYELFNECGFLIKDTNFTIPSLSWVPNCAYSSVIGAYNVVASTNTPTTGTSTSAAPTLTLLGANPVIVTVGNGYVDPGATAFDAVDGNITGKITTKDTVTTGSVGTYTVTYSVTNSAGLTTIKTRAVSVVSSSNTTPCANNELYNTVTGAPCSASSNSAAPTLTLLGANPVIVTVGNGYVDPGATAFDAVDGNITGKITTKDTVTTGSVGTYTVTYSVTNSAGLTTIKTRAVSVVSSSNTVNNPGNISITISANPTTIQTGQSSTISWSSTNATSCFGLGSSGVNGSLLVKPTQTTSYTLTCTGTSGTVSQGVTVTVSSTNNSNQPSGGGGSTGGTNYSVSFAPNSDTAQVASVIQGFQNLLNALTDYLKTH